ncbi:PREDICTED: sialidase-3-like [Gekko japonicus]|uniref:exo-alpha-sialidase n=1 Tax=Gekko japonicus TaxID=146911 RepID=A0ABM1K9X9_GEKJA|nr:PREDICTED: sialidase-3-like [Gekko japonicus]
MAKAHVGLGKVSLFRQESPEGLTYRIPALMYLPSESTFLAFAEERSSPSDNNAKSLVMRRGTKEGESVQWGPQEAMATALLPDHRTMNPCPVYDRKSSRIFLFFICVETHVTELHQIKLGRNAARLCYVSSQDGGRSWSQLTDLTHEVIGDDLKNWATFAVGPGHGLQTSSGRLVIPAYTYYIHKRSCGVPICCCTKPHCFVFYSDDGGGSWAQGQLATALRAGECQVAELTRQDGSQVLYCNARSPEKYRVEAFSADDGNRFEEPLLCKELPETGKGCQGSVVSFTPVLRPSDPGPWKNEEGGPGCPLDVSPSVSLVTPKQWLLYSHPTGRRKRVDLGIYLNTSPLAKGGWMDPWVLYEGPSGYSDLAVCEEGQVPPLFGCLFESGVSSELEEIAFQLFSSTELLRSVREG